MDLSVSLRSVAATGGLPAPVDFSTSQVNVAVFLAGDELAASSDWQRYLSDITEKTRRDPLACRVFPVAMTPSGQSVVPNVQAMRWNSWTGGEEERTSHLLFELTHELGRMLDAYHRHLRNPSQGASALMSIDPVRVFLSHSKHDTVGEAYATEMRNWLHERSRLNSFIDLVGIPLASRSKKC